MKGSGRFGSDAKQRLAARQVSLKREKNKASRERAFSSSPPPSPKKNVTSYNRFGRDGITNRDGVPDLLFQKAVEFGMDMAKDTGISVAQILNEGANQGGGRAIFGKDYLARGAGKLLGQEAQNTISGEVTPMDILNSANIVPGIGGVAGKGASGVLKLAEYLVPKASKFEPAMALASGGMTTRTPILGNISDVVSNYANASRLIPSVLKMSNENKSNPYDIYGHEDYVPENDLKEIDEVLGQIEEPTKTGVTKATKTTGFKLPDPNPITGRIDPFDIDSDAIITNTDFQAASLGIHHGKQVDDEIASAAMDELNDALGKTLKENKEGYRVYMDPVIPEGSSLARVIRQRFNVLDKDGRERFIQARVKDGYSEEDAANLWKGLGSKTDEELENWWTSFRQNNPEIPWDIQAINSEKHPDLWAHVGGIDFDHVFSAAGKNGTGKLENFVPIGHYINRLKGKKDGPEFLDYLAQNKPAIFAYLGGYDGPYAKSLAPAISAKRRTQPKPTPIPILGNGNAFKDYMRQLQGK